MSKVKKRTMGVALFIGAGAAAMGMGSGVASADEGVSLDGSAPVMSDVSQRIVDAAWKQYTAQNPGTFYSEGTYQAWCANFVSWVLKDAGAPLNSPNGGWRVPAVQTLNNMFESQGKLERPGKYAPKPGDVVLFGNDHTNLVVESDPGSGTITTVGGNESNKVSIQKLSYTSPGITGYGRVAEAAPAVVPVAAPEPFMAPAVDVFVPEGVAPQPAVEPAIIPVSQEIVGAPVAAVDVFVPEGVAPVAPPAPEFIPVTQDIAVDQFAPPPPPEFIPVVADIPVPDAAPVVDVFVPPAPDMLPSPAPDMVMLGAEVHMGDGALPGPAI